MFPKLPQAGAAKLLRRTAVHLCRISRSKKTKSRAEKREPTTNGAAALVRLGVDDAEVRVQLLRCRGGPHAQFAAVSASSSLLAAGRRRSSVCRQARGVAGLARALRPLAQFEPLVRGHSQTGIYGWPARRQTDSVTMSNFC